MNVIKTAVEGVLIIEPDVFADERGFFMVSYEEKRYEEVLGPVKFVQDNVSLSQRNVVRGLHYQIPPFGQGKLVQVLKGKIRDVAVDVRFGSPTFGHSVMVELSDENHRQFYIPEGFAHGFVTLSDEAIFSYKCTNAYSQEHDRGVLWSDPALGIDWDIESPIVSAKDRELPLLREIRNDFVF